MNNVVVPIDHNEIAQVLFEYSEDIPNDFYVNIMDLMKIYYETGNNLNQIHTYLDENKNRINKDLFKKIKKLLKPKFSIKNYCSQNCNCVIICPSCSCSDNNLNECYNCITSISFTCLFILVIIGMVVAVILSQTK